MGNYPFKLAFVPSDAPSSALSMDVPRVLVGLEMVDCHAIEAPYYSTVGSAIVDFLFHSTLYLRPHSSR
eukprot:scaffold421308_cov64-Attheya_sp.AAC.2